MSSVAVIGAGRVGTALGGRWAAAGHRVVFGVRDPSDPRHAGIGEVASPAEAVEGADVVLLAVPWEAAEDAVRGLGLSGVVLVDATNPLTPSSPDTGATASGAERIAAWTGARVVKAFNTVGSGVMADTAFPSGTPAMLLAGDDASAVEAAAGLARDAGFDPVPAGPLAAARDLEHVANLWIRLAYVLGNGPGIAFAVLRR